MTAEKLPTKLQNLVDELLSVDPETRGEMLIELSDQYQPVPSRIAAPPYPEKNRIPGCESEVFAFTERRPDGAIDFHFAVENPQGISAMAMVAIIQETVNGLPREEIQQIPQDVVYQIFGRTLSMGKGQGLMSLIGVLKVLAARDEVDAESPDS